MLAIGEEAGRVQMSFTGTVLAGVDEDLTVSIALLGGPASKEATPQGVALPGIHGYDKNQGYSQLLCYKLGLRAPFLLGFQDV
jgi:hypothetical protein